MSVEHVTWLLTVRIRFVLGATAHVDRAGPPTTLQPDGTGVLAAMLLC
jgi:hypothetical protein